MLGSRTDLHLRRRFSQRDPRYCNEILLPFVRLFEALWVCSSFHGRQLSLHCSCRTALREQTLGSSYLTTSNDSGASIGAWAAMPQELIDTPHSQHGQTLWNLPPKSGEIITKDRMFLGTPITGMFRPSELHATFQSFLSL
ncbi:hypothetical protein TNCV_2174501 [Trichonephila clavipes]|nr:hypothetical protein TNCV_2174501 [Trichonephila clavipes]